MNKYLNYWGLIFVIVILIPNIVFAITCKDGFENRYQNKLVEILEQIGRFGCFISMFLIIPFMSIGYWFKQGESVYLVSGVILVVLYCLGWIVFGKEGSIRKSLYLSIIPSLLFIESGIISGNILLLFFAVIFPINYRPILIDGMLEASYPSSTTLLVLSVMPTLVDQVNRRSTNLRFRRFVCVMSIVFSSFMVIGRLVAGVHWFTDIVGAVILSAGLYCLYKAMVLLFCDDK